MFNGRVFQQGDKISYVGNKFKSSLTGKEGFVVARVDGESNGYVIQFPEMKNEDQDYILPGNVLSDYRPSKNEVRQDKHDVKVEQRRHKGGKRAKSQQPQDTEDDE